jgi:DNA (cytosine-5)-methyltransferase 1
VGSLFAGIGGFDLAAERAGLEVKWQVEIDDYCDRVLEQRWPHVRRYRDIRTIEWADVEPVDIVCGGFPCQPHSFAGRRLGALDDRDLWPYFRASLRCLKPRWVVAENVPGILSNDAGRFFGGILRDLAACRLHAEWDCIPASAVGADHRRDRVWVVAHSACLQPQRRRQRARSDAARHSRARSLQERPQASTVLADTGREPTGAGEESGCRIAVFGREAAAHLAECRGELGRTWGTEPDVGRVAHGVPARVDRLRGLGNAIVPQVAEWIFRRILEAEAERLTA